MEDHRKAGSVKGREGEGQWNGRKEGREEGTEGGRVKYLWYCLNLEYFTAINNGGTRVKIPTSLNFSRESAERGCPEALWREWESLGQPPWGMALRGCWRMGPYTGDSISGYKLLCFALAGLVVWVEYPWEASKVRSSGQLVLKVRDDGNSRMDRTVSHVPVFRGWSPTQGGFSGLWRAG